MSKQPTTYISAEPISFTAYLKEAYKKRFLVSTFAKRGIKIKYAQTFLGVTWSLLQPLTGLVIFTFFFDFLISFDELEVAYPIYAFTGITIWNYFSYIFSTGSTGLREAADLIQKFSFPKVLFILSKAVIGFFEFLMALGVCIILLFLFGEGIGIQVLLLPLVIAGTALTGLGVALIVAAATVRFRDAYHIVPYLVNFGIWFTPIFFPTYIFPEILRKALWFNPMAGYAEFFRWSLLGGNAPDWQYIFGMGLSILIFVIGLIYMKRTEDKIVDYI